MLKKLLVYKTNWTRFSIKMRKLLLRSKEKIKFLKIKLIPNRYRLEDMKLRKKDIWRP